MLLNRKNPVLSATKKPGKFRAFLMPGTDLRLRRAVTKGGCFVCIVRAITKRLLCGDTSFFYFRCCKDETLLEYRFIVLYLCLLL